MATPRIDYERAAQILVDAVELGTAKAAEKWRITEKTVQNYRNRLGTDPLLSEAFAKLSAASRIFWDKQKAEAEIGWRRECHVALRSMLRAQGELVDRAVTLAKKSDDPKVVGKLLTDVSKAVERILQGEIASEALGVSSGNDSVGKTAPADAGGPAPEEPDDDR